MSPSLLEKDLSFSSRVFSSPLIMREFSSSGGHLINFPGDLLGPPEKHPVSLLYPPQGFFCTNKRPPKRGPQGRETPSFFSGNPQKNSREKFFPPLFSTQRGFFPPSPGGEKKPPRDSGKKREIWELQRERGKRPQQKFPPERPPGGE